MSKHLTPTEVCEALIGKPAVLAEICGVDPKAPFGWRQPSSNRLAGDLPSTPHQRALLAYSEANGLGLTADHLIRGATEAEVQDILSSLGTLVVPRFAGRRRAPPLQAAE
jgi:hypothetical protein